MSFNIPIEELPNSSTFGVIANNMLNSGRKIKGSIWPDHVLRATIHDFLNKWVQSSIIDRDEYFQIYIQEKHESSEKAQSYTLQLITSIYTYKDTCQEVHLLARLLNEPQLTKEVTREVIKLLKHILIKKRQAKTSRTELDKIFMTKNDIIDASGFFFPGEKDMPLKLIGIFAEIQKKLGKLERSERKKQVMTHNNIRGYDPSLAQLLEQFMEVLLKRKITREEAVIEKRNELEQYVSAQTMSSKIRNYENCLILDEDGNSIQKDLCNNTTTVKEALHIANESKLSVLREIETMQRSMNDRKSAMAKMLGTIKAIDDHKDKMHIQLSELVKQFGDWKSTVTTMEDKAEMYKRASNDLIRVLGEGSEADKTSFQNIRNDVQRKNYQLINNLDRRANNFANTVTYSLNDQNSAIKKDPGLFVPKTRNTHRGSLNFKKTMEDCYDEMKYQIKGPMDPHEAKGNLLLGNDAENQFICNEHNEDFDFILTRKDLDVNEPEEDPIEKTLDMNLALDYFPIKREMVMNWKEADGYLSDKLTVSRSKNSISVTIEDVLILEDDEDLDIMREEEEQEADLHAHQHVLQNIQDLDEIEGWEQWGDDIEKNKLIEWNGTMNIGGQEYPLKIANMRLLFDNTITGNGEDDLGAYVISGSYTKDGEVEFQKEYVDRSNDMDFNSKFTGQLGESEIVGKHNFLNNDGQNEECDYQIAISGREWTGKFKTNQFETHEVEKKPWNTKIDIDEFGAYGVGMDKLGYYIIKGDYDREETSIYLVMKYLKTEDCYLFTGVADELDHSFILKGEWQLQTKNDQDKGHNIPSDNGAYKLSGLLTPGPILQEEQKTFLEWGHNENKQFLYHGWFTDAEGSKNQLVFDTLMVNSEDYVIKGEGKNKNGEYLIEGKMTPGTGHEDLQDSLNLSEETSIEFTQILTEIGKEIKFCGVLEGFIIKGTWSEGSDSGNFSIEPAVHCSSGFHEQGGQVFKFDSLSFSVSVKGIYGLGHDENGMFIFKGDLIKEGHYAFFTKSYKNLYYIVYMGRLNISGGNFIIKGIWEKRNMNHEKIEGTGGLFEITGPFGDKNIISIEHEVATSLHEDHMEGDHEVDMAVEDQD